MYERVWRVQGSKALGTIYSHWGWCHSGDEENWLSLVAVQCKYNLFWYFPLAFFKVFKCLLASNFKHFIHLHFLLQYDSRVSTKSQSVLRNRGHVFEPFHTRFFGHHYLAFPQKLIGCKLVAISEELAFKAERGKLSWLTLIRWKQGSVLSSLHRVPVEKITHCRLFEVLDIVDGNCCTKSAWAKRKIN